MPILALLFGLLASTQRHSLIYVIDRDKLSSSEQVMAQTLQGLTGKRGARIWLNLPGIQSTILSGLKQTGNNVQYVSSIWGLVDTFRSEISGFIVYKLGTHSLNVANSLCGPFHAIAVDVTQIEAAKAHGLKLIVDAQGISEQEAFNKYHSLYKRGYVVEQAIEKPGALRDFAVLHDAFVMDTRDREFRKRVVHEMGPSALVFGWGPDEYDWITDISSAGGTGVGADWCVNLSALECLPVRGLKPPRWKPAQNEDGVRYIAFVLSDGDNVQWQTGGFVTDAAFYGSSLRGQFPMTWEVSPLLAQYAPTVLEQIYKRAKPTDDFVTGAGLPGYTYPHALPNRSAAAAKTAPLMRASGLRVASILNQNDGTLEETYPWLDLSGVDAVIYKDYSPYNRREGQVSWEKGKPAIAYRFVLWENLLGIDQLVDAIGKMPTNPRQTEGSYALINVHAWSYGSIGGPIEAVRRVISKLPPNTRVVTATQLIDLLKKNHSRG